tara:strand:+ start:923 stop:1558 length:636 start_codon:yes stop_codon:yes gene_type:complete
MSELIVKKRNDHGTSSSRRMRSNGLLPGIIYGSNKDPNTVEMNLHQVEQILKNHSSDSVLIEVDLEDEGPVRVLMKEVQYHPVTSSILHVDLQRIVAGKPIQVDVAVELSGESEGVKSGGIIDQKVHSLSIECLPKNIIESIIVDITDLEIGDALNVSDIPSSSKIKILSDESTQIVSINAPKVSDSVDEETDDNEDTVEPEVITEKTEEE